MQMDFRIPFMVQGPDIVGSLDAGAMAAARQNEIGRMNDLAALYQAQGADIFAGNPAALNALAQFDPMAAYGIADMRSQMDSRALQMDYTRAQMADLEARRAAEAQAAAAARAQAERQALIFNALPIYERGNPAEIQQYWESQGLQPLSPDQYMGALVQIEGGLDAMGDVRELNAPGGGDVSAAEEEIARFQEIINPNTGRPFTRQEAIEVTQLYTVSRDPVTGEAIVINRATGQPVGQATPAAQVAQRPAVVPPQSGTQTQPVAPQPSPDPMFNVSDPAARAAFGLRGFGANIANTVTDTLGMGQMFPEVSQAQTDFSVAAESILADMASAWQRQPPSWVLQAQNSLIPRPGSVFTGPDTAAEMLSAIRRNAEVELQSVTQRLGGAISPTVRAELEAQASALANGIAKLNSLTERLGDGGTRPAQDGENVTANGIKWRMVQ